MLKKLKLFFGMSVGSFCLSAVWLVFLPLADFYSGEEEKRLAYIIAAAFWLNIVFGVAFLLKTNSVRKKIYKKLKKSKYSDGKIGIFSFFKNTEAKICDIMTILLIAIVIVFTFMESHNEWVSSIIIAALFVLVILRSFFNGKNYCCIKAHKHHINKKEGMNHE